MKATEQARQERVIRSYRNHLREIGDVAARAMSGQGERRQSALADISRLSAKALREGA